MKLTKASSKASVALPIMCVVVAACTDGGDGVPAVAPDTGEGVEAVVSDRPQWVANHGWQLSDGPQLVIGEGTDDPHYLFSSIVSPRAERSYVPGLASMRGPFRLPNGEIAVGDLSSAEVRFFDDGGQFRRAAIGEGEGPTELGRLDELYQCVPGVLTALDRGRELLLRIDSNGEPLGRSVLDPNAGRDLYPPIACNKRGQILAMDRGESAVRLQDEDFVVYRTRVHVWVLDSEGQVTRDLGEFPGIDRFDYQGPGGRTYTSRPLGKIPALALGTDRAFIGTADSFEIEVWSLDGVLRQRWRRAFGDSVAREDDISAYGAVEDSLALLLQAVRRYFPTFPMPETYPAYTRFVLDATDHLWVEHFRTPRVPLHLWSVFSPEGIWLGEVEVPSRLEVTDIGADYVLGVYRDELDEQSVRMYRLVRSE